MAHKIIKTPGVLIHVNVVILAFLYVEIFTLVANDDNASWIGGTKLLVSNKTTKIKINGDNACKVFPTFKGLPFFTSKRYSSGIASGFVNFILAKIVHTNEITEAATPASSAPTKYETTISGIKKDNPETKTTGTIPLKAEPFPFVLFPKI